MYPLSRKFKTFFGWGMQIYGIDAASGAAVLALNISFGDHVLDLCAAPGKYIQPLVSSKIELV